MLGVSPYSCGLYMSLSQSFFENNLDLSLYIYIIIYIIVYTYIYIYTHFLGGWFIIGYILLGLPQKRRNHSQPGFTPSSARFGGHLSVAGLRHVGDPPVNVYSFAIEH